MRRGTKGLLAILIIVAITIPTTLYILNGILNPPPPVVIGLIRTGRIKFGRE